MKKNIFLAIFITFETYSFSQQTIFLSGVDNKLYNIDINNCLLSVVNDSPAMPDIAVTPDGNLWGYDGIKLWAIDQNNGQTTQIANANPVAGTDSLLALDNSTLLFESGQYLWKLNISNANATILGSLGYFAKDFAWYDNDLYMMTDNGLLIKIILSQSNSNIIDIIPINNINNPIPICEALVTAEFDGLDNALVGFSQNTAYKICPIDGSFFPLCSSLATQFLGADSARLADQIDPPIDCSQILSTKQFGTHNFAVLNPIFQNGVFELSLNMEIESQLLINIIDLHGKILISEEQIANGQNISFDISRYSLAKGIYIVEILAEDKLSYLKLLIQ